MYGWGSKWENVLKVIIFLVCLAWLGFFPVVCRCCSNWHYTYRCNLLILCCCTVSGPHFSVILVVVGSSLGFYLVKNFG